MSYSLQWRSPALPYVQKQTAITVPAGATVSNAASLTFTGKGAANYGKIQQENQLRLLENFAGDTAPAYATVGQTWYDTSAGALKVCISTPPSALLWRALNATQITDIGEGPPSPASLGDSWFSRTGSQSGILYVYTGLGRFPEQNWDAEGAAYYPAESTALALIPNQASFAGAPNFGEAYLHGYISGTAADVNGSILFDGAPTTAPKGALYTSMPVSNGYILWDSSASLVSAAPGTVYFSVRQLIDGRWQFDDNVTWRDFEPTSQMYAIGTLDVAEQDDGDGPGISASTLWESAIVLSKLAQVPLEAADGAIGGWKQVWPTVEVAGGREEYDYVAGLVAQLIGDPIGFGGSGALGKSVDYLPTMQTLDASLRLAWLGGGPVDATVLNNAANLGLLKIEPTSNDWDKLLAAAKYAIDRLELPVDAWTDVSELPFVQDGREAPAVLLAKDADDVQYPSARRTSSTKAGSITMGRLYQETVNVLNAAIGNRYALKGILGLSGSNTVFNSIVHVVEHKTVLNSDPVDTFATSQTSGMDFNFDFTEPELERFFSSGQAIELIVRHAPGSEPSAADMNLKTVCDGYGRFRITADGVYVMDSSVLPTLAQSPGAVGVNNLTSVGSTLASAVSGGASLVLRGVRQGGNVLRILIDINAGGEISGELTAVWNLIVDTETYTGGRVYPLPLDYNAADLIGTSLAGELF
jgi:hypothetical protein